MRPHSGFTTIAGLWASLFPSLALSLASLNRREKQDVPHSAGGGES